MTQNVALEHIQLTSADPNEDRIAQLHALFPEAFSEGTIDWERLRAALGEAVDERPERYSFTWAGKRDAIKLLQTPTRATLVPLACESLNWETTQNAFVEGDNLEVLKLLYKPYFGRVKMIYIDPPYNTGNDFIYPDNFADPLGAYLALTGQQDEGGNLLTSNPDTSGRYHSAWLSMMYPRFFLARQLLREDGVIFVSIDDHEVYSLRFLMNEVFGEENFLESFVWKKSYGGGSKEKHAVTQHEYVIMFARDADSIAHLWLPPDPEIEQKYYRFRDEKFEQRGPYRLQPLEAAKSMDKRPNLVFPIPLPSGGELWPGYQWLWKQERVLQAVERNELVFKEKNGETTVDYKQYLLDESGARRGAKPTSVIDGIYTQQGTKDLSNLFDEQQIMQYPKPVALMKQLLRIATSSEGGDVVIDFFAGSGTTAQAVLELNNEDGGNREFILVQFPERTPDTSPAAKMGLQTIGDIGKERIRRVIAQIEQSKRARLDLTTGETPEDLGFRVFKLAPSSVRPWPGLDAAEPEAYADQMALFDDRLVGAWQPDDVIWEAALKEGYGLNARVEKVACVTTNAVYRVADPDRAQSFYICLDGELCYDTVIALAPGKDDLFICRDAALNDELAANLALQCRLKAL